MEGPIIGAVLSSTLPKLYSATRQAGEKLYQLKADVRSIESELRYVQAAIQDYRSGRYDMSYVRRAWITDLRRLAYDIEDLVDRHGARKVTLVKLAAEIDNLKRTSQEISKQLHCYEKSKQKPQDGASSSTSGALTSHDQGIPGQADHNIVGMDKPLDELKTLLRESESRTEGKLKVISIVGFGGIGKTTLLASQVYDDVHREYPLHAFVNAGAKDKEEILKAILEKLPEQDFKGKSVIESSTTSIQAPQVDEASTSNQDPQGENRVHGTSASTLDAQINGGVYGASVSTKDPQVNNGVHGASISIQDPQVNCGLHGVSTSQPQVKIGVHGSSATMHDPEVNNGVEATTTSIQAPQGDMPKGVHGQSASNQDPQINGVVHSASATFPPRGDNGIHGWSASNDISQHRNDVETQLKSRLGTNRYFIVIGDVDTEQLGCDIISAFPQEKGVDSRIIVTTTIQPAAKASLPKKACSCGDRHMYKMRPLKDVESEAQFFRIVLDNNYKSLCSGLQYRLLYLCMFPRGTSLRRGPLIRRWLAEGPGMGCSDPLVNFETLVNRNFETLIDRNLISPIQVSNNEKVKACQLPGMTLEYITGISKSENFMMLSCGDGSCEPQDIRRLSLHHTGYSDDMRVLKQKELSRLRTLAVFYEDQAVQAGPLDFAKCKLLRVLDLEACKCVTKSHLEQICKLLHLLKYLSLRSSITKVPSKITSLQLLETLDLGKETVVTVPVDVIELPRLKHLLGKFKLLKDYSSKKRLIKFLEEESMLETLAGFVTRKGQGFPPLLRHMWQLRKVKIWCDSEANAGKLTHLSEALKEFLSRSCRMSNSKVPHSVSIDFQQPSETFPDFRWAPDCRGSLFSLKLSGHGKLTQIPAFVTSVGGITELCLSSTTLIFGDDALSRLSSLLVLEYLKLEATSSIEGDTEEGPVVIGREQLKSLKRMCLVAKEKLPCITIQPGALHSIVSLHLIWRGEDSRLPEKIKKNWEEAAKGHPNRPHVLCTAVQKKQTLPVP